MDPTRDLGWFHEHRDRTAQGRGRVGAFVPTGYEMYVRVMFPFQAEDLSSVSWNAVAQRFGVELSPHTGIEEITAAISAGGDSGLASMPCFSGLDDDVDVLLSFLEGPLGPAEPTTYLFSSVATSDVEPDLHPSEGGLGNEAVVVGVGTIEQALVLDANYVWPSDRRWVFVTVIDSMGSGILACDNVTGQKILDSEAIEAFGVTESADVSFLFHKWWVA